MKAILALLGLCLGTASAVGHASTSRHPPATASVKHASKGHGKSSLKNSNPTKKGPPVKAGILENGHDTLLEVGCLDALSRQSLLTRLELTIPETQNGPIQDANQSVPTACIPYAAAQSEPMVGHGLALLTSKLDAARDDGMIYTRLPVNSTTQLTPWNPGDLSGLRQVWAESIEREGPDLKDVPAHLQWEVDLITRHLISALKLAPESLRWRFTLQLEPSTGLDQIYAIECLDVQTRQRIEAAVWLDRTDVPGAYFSLRGLDYERMIWQSPVQNSRITRGVGPGRLSIKRPVTVKTKKRAKPRTVLRTFTISRHHLGIDFAAPKGTPVVAVADGEVVNASFTGGFGNLIVLDHGAGHQTYYAHLSAYAADLRPGTWVRRGEEIGHVGSTGFSTGPHLHFEIRKDGAFIDPSLKENRLKFWVLGADEQPELLTRLLLIQKLGSPKLGSDTN